ncbi:MAG: hypothetical protein M1834_005352 [Cirrosporium novae-zelandiae]|nr:MAG: hypothetical protein M1834_005352 [Cirrosporium novae-zelandiae]
MSELLFFIVMLVLWIFYFPLYCYRIYRSLSCFRYRHASPCTFVESIERLRDDTSNLSWALLGYAPLLSLTLTVAFSPHIGLVSDVRIMPENGSTNYILLGFLVPSIVLMYLMTMVWAFNSAFLERIPPALFCPSCRYDTFSFLVGRGRKPSAQGPDAIEVKAAYRKIGIAIKESNKYFDCEQLKDLLRDEEGGVKEMHVIYNLCDTHYDEIHRLPC